MIVAGIASTNSVIYTVLTLTRLTEGEPHQWPRTSHRPTPSRQKIATSTRLVGPKPILATLRVIKRVIPDQVKNKTLIRGQL